MHESRPVVPGFEKSLYRIEANWKLGSSVDDCSEPASRLRGCKSSLDCHSTPTPTDSMIP